MSATTLKILAGLVAALAVAAATSMIASGASTKFYADDPVWVERDTQNASAIQALDVDLFVDLTSNLVAASNTSESRRAANINTIGEVPDSSWFTNRLGIRAMTPEDVAIGPNETDGPAAGALTITSSKSDGVTPGFAVRDSKGERWFLKFEHYERVTSRISLDAPIASWTDRKLDGSYRVVASRALPGKPVGRVRFVHTRPDDPNDVVPHEDRRELRGYGVFAAWLNHVDAKAMNSLDMLVAEDGKSYVRHYLIDFVSALGSGGVAPADYWAGFEYLVQPHDVLKQMVGFGFNVPQWRTRPFYESRAIGRLPRTNADFNPDEWKPRVPNQAFVHATREDKFWAARKLSAITIDMIRAAVGTGEFGDSEAEEFLVRALVERREAILRTYLPAVNPVVEPSLDSTGVLTFRNAAVDADVARAPRGYRAFWSTFDNTTGHTQVIGGASAETTRLRAPEGVPTAEGTFVKVELTSMGASIDSWKDPAIAYFRRGQNGWKLVGFERTLEN